MSCRRLLSGWHTSSSSGSSVSRSWLVPASTELPRPSTRPKVPLKWDEMLEKDVPTVIESLFTDSECWARCWAFWDRARATKSSRSCICTSRSFICSSTTRIVSAWTDLVVFWMDVLCPLAACVRNRLALSLRLTIKKQKKKKKKHTNQTTFSLVLRSSRDLRMLETSSSS